MQQQSLPLSQSLLIGYRTYIIEDDDDGVVVCPDVQDVHKEGDDDDDGGV